MAEVSFEWADGPNANAEFHQLFVFSPEGEKVEPRMERMAYHKNGQWSYADQRVFVPAGSIVVQQDQSTHGSRSRITRVWLASAGRPEIFTHSGLLSGLATCPVLDSDAPISQAAFERVLAVIAPKSYVQWMANASVEAI